MEDFLADFYELILHLVLKSWNNFMKKRNPNYDDSHSKRIISVLFGVILFILFMAVIFGIIFLFKWIF